MNDPEIFRAQVGTTFLVPLDPSPVGLELVEVADERIRNGIQQFSLFFHGTTDRLLPQATYGFHHPVLGSLVLFIVPIVGSNHERIVYQACFSRPAPPEA